MPNSEHFPPVGHSRVDFSIFFWDLLDFSGWIYRLRARLSINVKKSRFAAKNCQIGRWEHSALRGCAECGTCPMASISGADHSHGSFGRYIAPNLTNCGSTGSYGPRLGRRDGSRGFFLVGPFFFSWALTVPPAFHYGFLVFLNGVHGEQPPWS